ncbi:2-(R)-hydroxypropyl-CoM dehydrogenase [Colletotrichum spinosum]|uniref:2-(R)-hydroxypropyl-CoM dehydrogenase n=1 Tax=Colletotrichum spinosum TaxID=1347390 RepID=A0A4R8Q878_9PEZI|nr:2-(R)-hydroxypropyl-CoM dehydrogenase [Colletotrichum spinosum]
MFRLPGVAFITGAGGTGIGAAVAKGFAHSGCTRFAITDLKPESLEGTRSAIIAIIPDAEVLGRAGDVSDESFVNHFVEEAIRKFSRIDYVVSCAGILGESMRSHETSIAAFDLITNVNYKGSWLVSRAILGHMIKQEPLEENADAIDYSQDGIRVNCVCPGVIATPMTTASEELVERLRPAINIAPMKRMGTPEEVANAVLFLSSTQASFVQGHALVVDGGYTIN